MKDRHLYINTLIGWFFFLVLSPIATLLAAENPIHFKRLSVDDGLSQNTALALTQDHNSKIWVGTVDGLNWYDGSRFVTFHKSLNDSTSLSNNHVYSLCTDRKGTVWAGTLVGLSRYNIVGNNFTNYSLPDHQPVQVFAIEELEDDNQLLLGTNSGLMLFDKTTGQMKVQPHLQGKSVLSICRMTDGVLLGTSIGVYFYYTRNGNVTQLLPQLKNEVISDILYDARTKYTWLSSMNNGVYCVDDHFQIRKHYNRENTQGQLPVNAVRTLQQDNSGRIWIGTPEGLLILSPDTDTFDICTFSYEDPTSLGHNSVRSILKDDQGGMWVGTYYGGLNYYHPMAPHFGILQHSENRNSLSDNTVSCMVEEPQTGNLWIGTNDGGLNYYERSRGVFTVYRAAQGAQSLKSNNIKCVLAERDGNVYVGTHGGGLSLLHTRSKRVEHYTFPGAVPLANSCYSLLDGKDGTIWVGAMGGLFRFHRQTKQLELHPLAKKHPKLKDALVNVLYRDSKGRIWIGTEESLFLYADGQLKEMYDRSSGHSRGLIQAHCVQEDSQHRIWVGSSAGLYGYQEKKPDTWERYSTHDGLPNDFIYAVLEDEHGRLWLTTNRGLSCFEPKEKTFLNFTSQDGLPHNQFNHYAACKAQDGTFFLGTLAGITYFNPNQFADNPFSPNAVITGAVVFNQVITDVKHDDMRYFQDEQGRMLGMSFPSSMKIFNIRFAVINYLSGKRNQFAYKLEGFDEDWNYSKQVFFSRASYSNLEPGRYVFKVKACNNNGKWSEATTEFFVEITPVWYQTWWAKTLFVLLALGSIAFVLYFFIARARMKMQLQIEHFERAKMEEISQEKVRFYINMSHELRTPLSLILAPLEELLKEKTFEAHVQQKLSYVYKNGQKLLRIVNQLLDFRKAESGLLPIHVSLTDVDTLAANVFTLFEDSARKRQIQYTFHSEIRGSQLPVDRMYMETMLTNLLSNAFKFTQDGGRISLSLWQKESVYGLTVTDSGIGIPPEKLKRVFERFYQVDDNQKGSGIGLALVKCLVEKHRGTITVTSEPEQSTAFNITLPADIEVFSDDERKGKESGSMTELASLTEDVFSGEVAITHEEPSEPEAAVAEGEDRATILLVDDNREMVDYLKSNFKSRYITLTAGNGEEALAIMKEQKVDIILSDVMMPGIDGIKLCELIKKNLQTCHIPVILLSAKGGLDAQTEGIQVGADDYIPKPFSMTLLKGKIGNLLKARQRMKHYYSDTINIDTAKMTSNALDEEFMSRAIKAVEEHIDNEDFTADDLAEKLYVSRSSLYLKMNSVSGEPPANFIRRIRFNKACKLLLEGRYSISEISVKVGFSSPSYFSTSFKKYVGCLPSEYVKNPGKFRF